MPTGEEVETVGYVILFHLDPPFKHARHCFDWAEKVDQRIKEHYAGKTRGPVLIHEALNNGSILKVGRLWPGTKTKMLDLRSDGNATRLCKLCKQEKKMEWQDEHLLDLLERSIELRSKEEE